MNFWKNQIYFLVHLSDQLILNQMNVLKENIVLICISKMADVTGRHRLKSDYPSFLQHKFQENKFAPKLVHPTCFAKFPIFFFIKIPHFKILFQHILLQNMAIYSKNFSPFSDWLGLVLLLHFLILLAGFCSPIQLSALSRLRVVVLRD